VDISAGFAANNHYIAGNRAGGFARATRFMTALDDIPAWPCQHLHEIRMPRCR
jgi:hypothetical protein